MQWFFPPSPFRTIKTPQTHPSVACTMLYRSSNSTACISKPERIFGFSVRNNYSLLPKYSKHDISKPADRHFGWRRNKAIDRQSGYIAVSLQKRSWLDKSVTGARRFGFSSRSIKTWAAVSPAFSLKTVPFFFAKLVDIYSLAQISVSGLAWLSFNTPVFKILADKSDR